MNRSRITGDLVSQNNIFVDISNDRVGIGSTQPTVKLDIMSADPVIRLTDTDPSGVYSQIDGAGGDLILAADGGGGSSSSFISFRTDGTALSAEKVRIDSSGRVLMGTTTEGYSSADDLTVATSGHTGITIRSGNTSLGTLAFSDGTSGSAEYDGYIQYSQNDRYMDFATGGGNVRLRITSGGAVGIGTNISLTDILTVNDTHPRISMRDNGVERAFIEVASNDDFIVNNKSISNTIFKTTDTDQMVLRSTGQLGIGTAFTPPADAKKLTVICDGVGDGIHIGNKENLYPAGSTGYSDIRFSFYDYLTGGYQAGGEAIIRGFSHNAYTNSRTTQLLFMTASDDGDPSSGTATEKVRITHDGDVAITTRGSSNTEGVSKVNVEIPSRTTSFSASDGDTWHDVLIENPGGAADNAVGLCFQVTGGSYHKNAGTGIAAVKNGTNSDYGSDLVFITRPQSAVAAERLRITSDGRLLLNHDSSRAVANVTPQVQLEGTTANTSAISITRNSANASPPYLNFGKSRATSTGGTTIIQDDDSLGQIRFSGADGNDLTNHAASIEAFIDGTPSNNVTPGRLIFSTTSSTGSDATERLRITSAGRVGIGITNPARKVHLHETSANTAIYATFTNGSTGTAASNGFTLGIDSAQAAILNNYSSTDIKILCNGGERLRIDSSGNFDIPFANNGTGLRQKIRFVTESTYFDEVAYISADRTAVSNAPTDLVFGTGALNGGSVNTQERLRITSDGKIGIGNVSSPVNNMEMRTDAHGEGITIRSTGNTSNALTFDANRGTEGVIGVMYGRWNGTTVAQISFVSGTDGTNKDDGVITFGTESAASNGNVNAGEKMRLDSSGRLGIGTAAPDTLLHLKASSGSTLQRFQTANYSSYISQIQSAGNVSNGTGAGQLHLRGQAGLSMSANNGTSTHITIDSNGNISQNSGGSGFSYFKGSSEYVFGSNTSSPSSGGAEARLQVHDSKTRATLSLNGYMNNGGAPFLQFISSRSGTVGTLGTKAAINDFHGDIRFFGDNGTNYQTLVQSAQILVRQKSTISDGDTVCAGEMQFYVGDDSGGSIIERLKIYNSGGLVFSKTTSGGQHHTGNVQNQFWKVGEWTGVGAASRCKLTVIGASTFDSGSDCSGMSHIYLAMNADSAVKGYFNSTGGPSYSHMSATGRQGIARVAVKRSSGSAPYTVEIWIAYNGGYSSTAIHGETTVGTAFVGANSYTASADVPSGADELESAFTIQTATGGTSYERLLIKHNGGVIAPTSSGGFIDNSYHANPDPFADGSGLAYYRMNYNFQDSGLYGFHGTGSQGSPNKEFNASPHFSLVNSVGEPCWDNPNEGAINIPNLKNTYPFSMAAWINVSSWPTTGDNDLIMNLSIGNQRISLSICCFNTHVSDGADFYIMYGGKGHHYFRPSSKPTNEWIHVVYSVVGDDNTDHRVYQNGSDLTTRGDRGGGHGGSAGWALGGNASNSERFAIGRIGSIRFFNKALSSSEASALYNNDKFIA